MLGQYVYAGVYLALLPGMKYLQHHATLSAGIAGGYGVTEAHFGYWLLVIG